MQTIYVLPLPRAAHSSSFSSPYLASGCHSSERPALRKRPPVPAREEATTWLVGNVAPSGGIERSSSAPGVTPRLVIHVCGPFARSSGSPVFHRRRCFRSHIQDSRRACAFDRPPV